MSPAHAVEAAATTSASTRAARLPEIAAESARLGFGIGLRAPHYPEIEAALDEGADSPLSNIDWFEALTDNYLAPGGRPRAMLRRVREHLPVVLHGVGLSLGSTDPLDEGYLERLARLEHEIQPSLVSDHLAWTGVAGRVGHDLYPMPLSEEAAVHVSTRIAAVQDRLRRRILVENVSSYAEFAGGDQTEADFVADVVHRADCLVLLDVNNVFVSAHNHGFDAAEYIRRMPRGHVAQIHLAGHTERGALLLDTHDRPVRSEVWDLYRLAIELHGPTATLIEWDDELPPLARVAEEAARARAVAANVLEQPRARVG